MKLYTKKIICTVLAMGGVVCSSVDARVVKRKRKERCAGAIANAARKAGATGAIVMHEIEAKGNKCTYTGSVPGVPTSMSYDSKEKKDMLDQYQKYITENDECDPEKTVCLIDTGGKRMTRVHNIRRVSADAGSIMAGGVVPSVALDATKVDTEGSLYQSVRDIGADIGAGASSFLTTGHIGTDIKCKKMCEGYFVNSANKKGVNVLIDSKDIQHMVEGAGRNRKCLCKYTGPENGFARNATFLQRESRKSKKTAELKSYATQANAETCNLLKETCIADIPKELYPKQQCILAFWKHGKTNGLRGTIIEKHDVVKASKDKNNTNKLKCEYTGSIAEMPPSLTIDNDPKNQPNRTTYATQMHLGNNVCKGQHDMCLYKGQK